MSFESIMNSGVALMESLGGDDFTQNGKTYRGNFRTGNSLEQAEASDLMRQHGYLRGIVLILHVSRSQFDAPPIEWEKQKLKIKRITPTAAEYTVISVNADDPNIYAIILIGRQ